MLNEGQFSKIQHSGNVWCCIQKVLQQFYKGYCNNRTDNLKFKSWKVKPTHPWGAVDMGVCHINFWYEILISWKCNNQNQICHQSQIQKFQNLNYPFIVCQCTHNWNETGHIPYKLMSIKISTTISRIYMGERTHLLAYNSFSVLSSSECLKSFSEIVITCILVVELMFWSVAILIIRYGFLNESFCFIRLILHIQ